MERFVRSSIDDLEMLFVNAQGGRCDVDEATYPPGCAPLSGPLRFRLLNVGGIKVEVERRDLQADDFRLAVLFHGGSCVFADAYDLADFFRGPVASAFDITAEPVPARPATALLEDLRPRSLSPRPSRTRRKPRPAASAGNAPSSRDLEVRLAREVRGQEGALARIADVVSAHLVKKAPARPESLLLIGPTGTGKTSAVEALPAALEDLGCPGVHVFRVDCGELVDDYDVHRFLGAAPGLVGYTEKPPLVAALRKPRCIVLLDEIEKAHEGVLRVFLGLLDEGRVTAPDWTPVEAPGVVVAMTSNIGADDLAYRLRETPSYRGQDQIACREHLLLEGWPAELVGRIGSFAFFWPLSQSSLRDVAEDAIRALAQEFGLEIEAMAPVLADVVQDLADASEVGARALNYAARDLLIKTFADAARNGVHGTVFLEAGPPPRVVAGTECLF